VSGARNPAVWILLRLIRLYQVTLSSIMGTQCRFYPSCSHYMAEAVARHGAARGFLLGISRISRCHPWHAGGYDPVPESPPKFFSKNRCKCDTHVGSSSKTSPGEE
jgi:putative membrane protein insertion efficiency factor